MNGDKWQIRWQWAGQRAWQWLRVLLLAAGYFSFWLGGLAWPATTAAAATSRDEAKRSPASATATASNSATLPLVRVAVDTTAQSDIVTLGEIAEVLANDPAVVERLRNISLGYAPQVGVVREVPRERLALYLSAAGFPPNRVRLIAPPSALLRRAAQSIAPELVREAVERVTLGELQGAGVTARLSRLDLPAIIEAPSGPLEIRAVLGGVRDLFTPFGVSIEMWQAGRVVRRFSTMAQVEAFAPVLVAARALPAGVRLRKDDVKLEVRRLERPLNSYLCEEQRLRGTSLHRPLARGQVLTTDGLAADIVVRTGDVVRIVSDNDRLQIAAQGEARTAGRIGDRIQVKNAQSGQLLQAVIVDEGLVRVQF